MLLLLEIVAAMFISRVLYGMMRKWSDNKGYSLLKPMLTVASVIGVLVLTIGEVNVEVPQLIPNGTDNTAGRTDAGVCLLNESEFVRDLAL